MALKEGKKLASIKASVADNIGVPRFPSTNIVTEIAKPVAETIDTFRKIAEADAKVDWQYNFNKSSRDHYLNLKEKFKFDPDGMKNAIDAYSQSTLQNTPKIYRSVAENLLAQKNLANMSYATTYYENKKTQDLLAGWEETKDNTINDVGSFLDTIVLNDQLSAMDINSHVGNVAFTNLNHNYGEAEETMVNTNRIKPSAIKKDLENNIIDIETLRVFNLIKKLGDVEGAKYFTNYAAGQDDLPITPDNVNNPIFQKYANDIRNPFKRQQVIQKVKSLYNDYRGIKIGSMKDAEIKYDLDGLQDYQGLLDVNNFRDGVGNASNWVITNMPGISKTDFPKAVEIVDKNIAVQKLVSRALNKEIIEDFESSDQKELFVTALFRRHKINNENITDVNNPKFGVAMDILKNQNIEPTAVVNRLESKYNVDFKTPGMIEKFEQNLALYNFIKSDNMFKYLPIENEHIYKAANAAEIITNPSKDEKANRLNSIVGDYKGFEENYNKHKKHIEDNIELAVGNMRWTINMQDINTDTWWLKKTLFPSQKNKFAHMFIPEETTWWYHSTKMTPAVQKVWIDNTITQMAHMYGNKEVDLNTDKGKVLFYKASMQALNSMNRMGYSATRLNGTGEISMVKHGFEKEVGFTGQGLDSALIAQANYLKENLSKEEQEIRFGSIVTSPDGKQTKPEDIYNIMKTEIDNGKKNLIIEPTGTFHANGKPQYHVKLIHKDKIINLTQGDNYFDPTGLGSNKLASNKLPGSRSELMNTMAEKRFDLFMKKFGNYIDGDSATERWIRKFLFSTTKTMIEASDYRFYPDYPLVNDVPAEVKPFGFIFKVLGKDLDVEAYYDQGAKINNEIDEYVSYDRQIQDNEKISPRDKILEASSPPHKTSYTEQNVELSFRQHVYNNYENKSLPLTFRTNNYMAVMKTDQAWEGEIKDVSTGNQAAIFASPVDSIRAGVRVMINNSSLSPTETTKRYGDEPTVEEILSVYAEDTESYLNALEEKSNFTRDSIVNFFDSNQMMALIKFMIEHEMGSENFYKYYPPGSDDFLDGMILEGYTRGINSYGGTLGKMN